MTGSVRVVSDGPIGGLLRFDLPGVGAGVVGASLPISDALFPVRRQEGGITTWAAIHNLESSPGLLRCDLMREGVLPDWHIDRLCDSSCYTCSAAGLSLVCESANVTWKGRPAAGASFINDEDSCRCSSSGE